MLTFESYKQRLERGLSFIEFNYQLLQSYDFLVLHQTHNATLQIGGDDQWGNIVAGIELIRKIEGKDSYGLTFNLITRSDGQKMGKSEKGAVFLDPEMFSPYDFFQYWRNVNDEDVIKFLKLFTFLSLDEIKEYEDVNRNINEAKERLAFEQTKIIHGEEEADKALSAAKAMFGSHKVVSTEGLPFITLEKDRLEEGIGAIELFAMTDLCSTNGDARRLISQGGASINDKKLDDIKIVIDSTWLDEEGFLLLKAGKKRYFKVIVE
jgi:tyrosyl-tRNA synthetase